MYFMNQMTKHLKANLTFIRCIILLKILIVDDEIKLLYLSTYLLRLLRKSNLGVFGFVFLKLFFCTNEPPLQVGYVMEQFFLSFVCCFKL
jgi:hypothetical protein